MPGHSQKKEICEGQCGVGQLLLLLRMSWVETEGDMGVGGGVVLVERLS